MKQPKKTSSLIMHKGHKNISWRSFLNLHALEEAWNGLREDNWEVMMHFASQMILIISSIMSLYTVSFKPGLNMLIWNVRSLSTPANISHKHFNQVCPKYPPTELRTAIKFVKVLFQKAFYAFFLDSF